MTTGNLSGSGPVLAPGHEVVRSLGAGYPSGSFGYMASGWSPDEIRSLEDAGADSFWAGGHIASRNPTPEAMMGLARLAAHVQRGVVGTSVLLLPLYPPAIVAKQIADLDNMTGGRVVLGVGLGGEYPDEFSACQVRVNERGRRMDEALPLLRRLWGDEPVSSSGPFYPMHNVHLHPQPTRPGGPPILMSGRRDRAMRRAATVCDGWIPYMYSPTRYAASTQTVRQAAAEVGRDLEGFVWAVWTFVCIDRDGGTARRRAGEYLLGIGHIEDTKIVSHVTVAGTPNEVTRRLQEFVDAGVEHFVVSVIDCANAESTPLFVQREVVPNLNRDRSVAGGRVAAS
jgi:alkanesulfonate monooxygenase SsuD/methylene tetrahydromethanopterin reductase-like flavin-dependent oxidoreductase (luciferase family)